MKKDREKAIENGGCSIPESANMLGLESAQDRVGEVRQHKSRRVVQAISEKCAQAVSLEETETNEELVRHFRPAPSGIPQRS